MARLSKRLMAVAALAGKCETAADVGTDHAYVPIWLVSHGNAQRAIALDVNEGPLGRARENIARHGLGDKIEARLSDGLSALAPGEADVIVAAGMGGALLQRILTEGREAAFAAMSLVLQPQSELFAFRQFLWENGYEIMAEDMVEEYGKYYPMLSVRPGGRKREAGGADRISLKFGPCLLKRRHPVLRQYLLRQERVQEEILRSLKENARRAMPEREGEAERDLADIRAALRRF